MYVYLIKSKTDEGKKYVGITSNVNRRLHEHNQGKSIYTSKHRPWELVCVTWFKDVHKARKFERYLKIGSGHAFAKRHLW